MNGGHFDPSDGKKIGHFHHGYEMARDADHNGGANYKAMDMTVVLRDSRDFHPEDEYGQKHIVTQGDGTKRVWQTLPEMN